MSLLAMVNNELTTATPHAPGICPHCDGRMIAHCGRIVTWHWAHVVNECDPWHEPESQWHLATKTHYQALGCTIEKRLRQGDQWHVADIVTPSGRIIELQHSTLRVDQIADRERFYGDMIWIWDAKRWAERIHYGTKGFWWKHGARSQTHCQRPTLWDTGDGRILHVKLNDVVSESLSAYTLDIVKHHRVLGKTLFNYWTHEAVLAAMNPYSTALNDFSTPTQLAWPA